MSLLSHAPDSAVLLSAALAALAALAAYVVAVLTYNIYLHPLASFPGPPLAGATVYWKAYIECIANRSFCHYLVDLHARYGDIVRVGPNEASKHSLLASTPTPTPRAAMLTSFE